MRRQVAAPNTRTNGYEIEKTIPASDTSEEKGVLSQRQGAAPDTRTNKSEEKGVMDQPQYNTSKKTRRGNVSIFVPHNGCPHQCSFCDQRSITGVKSQPSPADVDSAVQTALSSKQRYDLEIAFFGGSFTAIDRTYMISLLDAANVYVKRGDVSGIRVSTRPDYIDEEVLTILKSRGVTAIELGAQSMCDEVLRANRRGHTENDVENASRLIRQFGISLGLQMMTGLYKSDRERDIYTAKKIIALAPDTVRIYPTVTIKGTMLASLFESGEYKPMELEESVELCAVLLKMFLENNIEVIRLGLHYSDELVRGMAFDNYHPAFRELCENKIMLERFFELCRSRGIEIGSSLRVYVNPSCVSKFTGQSRANIKKINERGINVKTIPDGDIKPYDMKIEPVSEEYRGAVRK